MSIVAVVIVLANVNALAAQDVPAEYQQVLSALGKQGDYKANVLKAGFRHDS